MPGWSDSNSRQKKIDRLSIGVEGTASLLSSIATVDFYRGVPPGGYTKGLPVLVTAHGFAGSSGERAVSMGSLNSQTDNSARSSRYGCRGIRGQSRMAHLLPSPRKRGSRSYMSCSRDGLRDQ